MSPSRIFLSIVLCCGLGLGACRPSANAGSDETDPNARPLIAKAPPAEGSKKGAADAPPAGPRSAACQDLTDLWYECIFEENPAELKLAGAPTLGAKEPLVTVQLYWSLFCPDCSLMISSVLPNLLAKHPADLQVQLATLPSFAHPVDLAVMQAAYEIRAQKGDEAFWKFLQAVHQNPEALYIQERQLTGNARVEVLKIFNQRCDQPQFAPYLNVFRLCEKPDADCNAYARCVQEHFLSLVNGRPVPTAKTQTPTCAQIAATRFDCIMKDQVFDIPVEDSPRLGDVDAPATLVVFSDLENPDGATLHQRLKKLQKTLGTKLAIVFKHFVQPFHKDGLLAARLGDAIFRKKGAAEFFRFHDTVFDNQDKLSRDWLVSLAQKHGLKTVEAAGVVDSRDPVAPIRNDRDLGNMLKIEGTPAVFLNGVQVVLKTGKPELLEEALRAELDRVEKAFPKHDRKNLYARITQTGRAHLRDLIKATGVDPKRLDAALLAQTHKKTIVSEHAFGEGLCPEMPCLFINGKKIHTDPRPLMPRFFDEARFALAAGVARSGLYAHLANLKSLIQTLVTDAALLATDVFDFTAACNKPTGAWTDLMPAFLACTAASKNCAQYRHCVLQKKPRQ